jgi:hypothetical protein
MRPKLVLTVMALAALVLAAAFHLKDRIARSRPQTLAETATLPPPNANAGLVEASPSASKSRPAPARDIAPLAAAHTMTPEQKEAYIEDEVGRLQDLSTRDDAASLSAILRDLTNSEKQVRLSAVEAAKQFGGRDAIPTLKADVANTQDIGEQIALLEAADFLSLPTIADLDVQQPKTPEQMQAAQQRRDQRAARRQAQTQPPPPPDQSSPADPNN